MDEALLSSQELERGWVAFTCDEHGFLVATNPNAMVNCRCGRVARRLRNGRIVGDDLRPTTAKARADNRSGHPVRFLCAECGEDFGSKSALSRHRVGGRRSRRCRTSHEMTEMGWWKDEKGRWRQRGSLSRGTMPPPLISEASEAVLAAS